MTILDLNTYKAYKSINSDKDDIRFTLIIDAVNAFIEQYTGRVFTTYYDIDKTEYFNGLDLELYPMEYPIQSITSLHYSNDAGATYTIELVEYIDYIIDKYNNSIISLKNGFCSVDHPVNAIKLVYKGGYATVPKDLELVAVHLSDYYKDEDYTPRKSLAGASIDNVIQPDMTARLPAHIRRVLDSYRLIVF